LTYGGIKIAFPFKAGYCRSVYVVSRISVKMGAFDGPLTVKFLTPKALDSPLQPSFSKIVIAGKVYGSYNYIVTEFTLPPRPKFSYDIVSLPEILLPVFWKRSQKPLVCSEKNRIVPQTGKPAAASAAASQA